MNLHVQDNHTAQVHHRHKATHAHKVHHRHENTLSIVVSLDVSDNQSSKADQSRKETIETQVRPTNEDIQSLEANLP